MGNLWLGGLHGLHFLEVKQDFDFSNFGFDEFKSVGEGVIGDKKVYSLKIYQNKYVIIGTEKGIGILNLERFYTHKYPQWLFFNKENGFSAESCEQNTIWAMQNEAEQVWVGHNDGATLLKMNSLLSPINDSSSIVVQADSIKENNKMYRASGTVLRAKSNETALTLYFSVPHKDIACLEYQIDNIGNFVSTPNNSISLPKLIAGKHSITLYAIATDGSVSQNQLIEVNVPIPFYKTTEFFVFLGLSFISIFCFIIYRKYKILEIKNEETQSKAKLELDAVLSQLNPHFIKNSINWISYRLEEDKIGMDFLSKFSQNIHDTFLVTSNKKAYRTVKDELEFTQNYLQMEAYRHGESKICRKLPNLKDIEHLWYYKLPLFQLQIHCENAVNHGLKNNDNGSGTIRIDVEDDENYIYFVITDDGVGRKEAAIRRSPGTRKGVEMLKKIHAYFNHFNQIKYQNQLMQQHKANSKWSYLVYSIIYFIRPPELKIKLSQSYTDDLFVGADNQKYGTKVTINIPKNFKYV